MSINSWVNRVLATWNVLIWNIFIHLLQSKWWWKTSGITRGFTECKHKDSKIWLIYLPFLENRMVKLFQSTITCDWWINNKSDRSWWAVSCKSQIQRLRPAQSLILVPLPLSPPSLINDYIIVAIITTKIHRWPITFLAWYTYRYL